MKIVKWLSDILKKAGGVCLVGMMLLTCADVVSSFFGYPLLGSEEVAGMMAFLLLSFTLPSAELEKAHVGVDLLHMRLSPRVRNINDCVVAFVSTVVFSLVVWQCWLYANEIGESGQVSTTLQFPTFYLIYGVAFACAILALVIFMEFFIILKRIKTK
ncbi:MAG TPA: TRAP transporter small permease [Desulfobacteraceae bacterium]|nr:TRAP transporter small permease [Desulfobacteraceae bacterium]HPJ67703.1 TRAP transporter small permease [Desulfobacteraceae bacterium]HPQ29416.1 TRAP transporter small permease [Desulfobacteraceae bacterium]